MSQRRLNNTEVGLVTVAAYEYAAVYEYLGENRYLQAAFCKSVRQLYSAKFGPYTTKYLSNIAAEGGFIGVLEWSKNIGCRWNASVFASGLKGGHVNILQFLKDNDCPIPDGNAPWAAAAERGHVKALQFAYDSKYRLDIKLLCGVAAKNGHFSILKWVHEVEGSRHFDEYTCQQAAWGGFIDIIQWLRNLGCAWNECACHAAVEKGKLSTLKWLVANGCPFNVKGRGYIGGDSKLGIAASIGHVELIRFLINECNADVNSTADDLYPPLFCAVGKNNLEAVQLLLDSGADVTVNRYGSTALKIAQGKGYAEIVEVLRNAGAV